MHACLPDSVDDGNSIVIVRLKEDRRGPWLHVAGLLQSWQEKGLIVCIDSDEPRQWHIKLWVVCSSIIGVWRAIATTIVFCSIRNVLECLLTGEQLAHPRLPADNTAR